MLLVVQHQVAGLLDPPRAVARAALVALAQAAVLAVLAVLVVLAAVPVVVRVPAVGPVVSGVRLGDRSAVVVVTKMSCNRSISSSPIALPQFLKERSLLSVGCQLRSSLQS
jgi:hypothetical protein